MDRIIVAFENENNRKRLCEMLESSGLTIKAQCRSGAEAIRSIRKMNGGIVICGYKLSEMTASDMAYDLGNHAMVLVVAPPQQLDMCRNDTVFKLPTPFSKGDLVSSVRMLLQLEQHQIKATPPRRSDKDMAEITKAKELLMQKNCMTEEEAHRFIQRRSMDSGMKAIDTARLILETYS